MSYEARIILRMLSAILKSSLPKRHLINMLAFAIESNEHMLKTDELEQRILGTNLKKIISRNRRDTLRLVVE